MRFGKGANSPLCHLPYFSCSPLQTSALSGGTDWSQPHHHYSRMHATVLPFDIDITVSLSDFQLYNASKWEKLLLGATAPLCYVLGAPEPLEGYSSLREQEVWMCAHWVAHRVLHRSRVHTFLTLASTYTAATAHTITRTQLLHNTQLYAAAPSLLFSYTQHIQTVS